MPSPRSPTSLRITPHRHAHESKPFGIVFTKSSMFISSTTSRNCCSEQCYASPRPRAATSDP